MVKELSDGVTANIAKTLKEIVTYDNGVRALL